LERLRLARTFGFMPSRGQIAVALAAAAVSGALVQPSAAAAAACASADAVPAQASRAAVTRAGVCMINAERRAHALAALRVDPRLSMAARRHSVDMVRRHYFAHTGPAGDSFVRRIRRAGYLRSPRRWLVGETLGWGWGDGGSAHGIVRAWMHSPEHRKILLTPSYREVGVGVVWGGPRPLAAPEATFTADFGVTN
jgi:uncharacterized protein YkwD